MNNSSVTVYTVPNVFTQDEPVISDETIEFLEKFTAPNNLILSLLGVVTNSINIRVFLEQGVKNSNTNIGLLALSIFDFLSCFLKIALYSCAQFIYTPYVASYISCRTHANYILALALVFNHCSNWTTVYISMERTLCVLIPLKVKLFLRPKNTVGVIITIFLFYFITNLLYTSSTSIAWRFNSELNQSIPYLNEKPFAKKYISIVSTMVNTVLNTMAIFIVAINTAVMIYKLNQFKKWRSKNINTTTTTTTTTESQNQKKDKKMSSKDVELVKSVTAVTCVFLVCLSISQIRAAILLIFPSVSFEGINRKLMLLTYSLSDTFSILNASVNTFFYLRVSSLYKEAFNVVFSKCRTAKT